MRGLIRILFLAAVLPLVTVATAQVQLGSDLLAANGFKELQGKHVGLITNPSGINRNGESTIDLLRRAPGVHRGEICCDCKARCASIDCHHEPR